MAGNAQEAYINANFDQGLPTSFIQIDNDGNEPSHSMQALGFAVGTGWIVYQPDGESSPLACSTSWYTNKGTSDDWLITPAFTVKSADDVLRWRARASNSNHRDGYAVYVSANGGATISDFDKTTPLFSVDNEEYTWTSHKVSLASWLGKTIRLAFVNNSTYQTSLYLDDVFAGQPSTVYMNLTLPDIVDHDGKLAVTGYAYTDETEPVNGFDVSFTYNGTTISEHFDSVLTAGHNVPFELKDSFTVVNNSQLDYSARISNNDQSYTQTGSLMVLAHRNLAEESTGTWCAWCVRGIVFLEKLAEQMGDSFIQVCVHSDSAHGDPMVNAAYEEAINAINSGGFPKMIFNRDSRYAHTDPLNCLSVATRILGEDHPQSGLDVQAVLDASTNEVNVTANTYFPVDADTMDYRLGFVAIENDVHSDDPSYAQNNAGYSGGDAGEMGGWENKPESVPASEMYYQAVARCFVGDFNGMEGSVPTTVKAMQANPYSISFALPSTVMSADKVQVIALLINKNNVVVNAAKTNLSVSDDIRTINTEAASNDVRVAVKNGLLQVDAAAPVNQVSVWSVAGDLVAQAKPNSRHASLRLSGLHGVYLVKVCCGSESAVRKVVIR